MADDTRERIIQVAGEIFAHDGFQKATVRVICERAEVNVAAVNYYFRDKLGLYTEVLRESMVHDSFPPPAGSPATSEEARAALRVFVGTMMTRLLRAGQDSWRMHIMAREMVQPTPALKTVVEQTIRPKAELLRKIIGTLAGLPYEDARVRQCAFSVVSQCLMYRLGSSVLRELWPDVRVGEEQAEQLATHITEFSLKGIEGIVPEGTERKP